MAGKKEGEPQALTPEQQMAELFKSQAVKLLETGKGIVSRLNELTANQQTLRKKTEDSIKQDQEVKEISASIEEQIKGLLDIGDERVFVLIEDALEEVLDTVKESAKNYLEGHASEEARSIRAEQETKRTEFDKTRTLYGSAKTMAEYNGVDVSDLEEFPSLARGGRPKGTGTGTRGPRVRNFTYHFTRNGERQNTYDNLSRALWYSSAKSGGKGQGERLTVVEFKELLKAQTGFTDELAQNWEVELPNKVKLGFIREEKVEGEATPEATEAPATSVEQ